MLKEILSKNDSLENQCESIEQFFNSERDFYNILKPDEFIKDFVPFSVKILRNISCEKDRNHKNNKYRYFVLNTLVKIYYEKEVRIELIEALNDVFEKDNFINVILCIKVFTLIQSAVNLDENLMDNHINVILQLINQIFGKLDFNNDIFIEESFDCLKELFIYILDLNIKYSNFKKKIEVIIFRCVNFYISYLDESAVIENLNQKKNISLKVISSISKLIKLIANTNVFISRNESYSIIILELSKFSLFYCPISATEIRKELFHQIFAMIIKSREIYVRKIEELYDLRFFYNPGSYFTNIKGLIGLTDILVSFFDNFNARTFFELSFRTAEILNNSLTIVKKFYEKKEHKTLEIIKAYERKEITYLSEDIKFLVYENSLYFHLDVIKEIINCLIKQVYTIGNSRLQGLEQLELSYKAFVFVVKTIETIEKFPIDNADEKIMLLFKKIVSSISKFNHQLSEKLFACFQSTSESLITTYYKKDDFFHFFDISLDLFSKLSFDEEEFQVIDDYFSIFCLPFECVFIDLNKRYCKKIVNLAHKKIFVFELIKKFSLTTINQHSGCSIYILMLKNLLEKDLRNNFTNIVNQNTTNNFLDRKDNRYNFYNLFFTIIINTFCLNSFIFTLQDRENLIDCINFLVKSKEIDLHEILLLCLKSLNNLKETSNTLQMYFFKNFYFYVNTFFDFYKKENQILYLELIFLMPMNLNLVLADWKVLILPMIESLKTKGDVAIRALNYLQYLIDNSKKETYTEEYNTLLFNLFKEVKSSLSNQKLSIYCATILGRLKSFHKRYLYDDLCFEEAKSFLHDQIYAVSSIQNSSSNLSTDNQEIFKFQLHKLIIEVIYFFRGDMKFNNTLRIRNHKNPVMFKCFDKIKNDNKKQVQAAFEILSGFIYKILGFDKYNKYNITEQILCWWCDLHKNTIYITKQCKEKNDDIFLADICNSSYYQQLKKSQYIYDSIQALYACEGTAVESNALNLLKCISEVATSYFIARRFEWARNEKRIYFNSLLLYRAFLEGFEFDDKRMPIVLLHDLLTRALENLGSSENFLKIGILQFIYKQLSYLCSSSNIRKIRAGCNGFYGLIIWDYLPMSWVEKELSSIVTCMLTYVKYSEGKFNKILKTFEFLYDLLIINEVKNCEQIFYTSFINFLMSKNEHERIFAKRSLILLHSKFKENDFLKIHSESVKLFLKDIGDKHDVKDIFIRLDVLIYVFKKFPFFLSSSEFKGFVKMYFFYLKHNQVFVIPNKPFYQTDVKIIYSDKENCIKNNQNFIYELYFEKSDCKSYTEYLKYESAFLYLAYCNNKEKAKMAFDYIFYTLPKGLTLPFKGFGSVNNNLIETLIREKYEECVSEVLTVETIKKMICILLLLPKFDDERLVAFIEKIFVEFRNHREISIFTECEENSILIKTFELSLMYPQQEQLYDKILLMVYPLLFEFSKFYISKIEDRFLDYIERFSNLTFPLIVLNISTSSICALGKILFAKIHTFKNYVSNLGISNKRLGLIPGNIPNEDEVKIFTNNLDISNPIDLEKGINLLQFLQLIEYEVTDSQIYLLLKIYREIKKQNKDAAALMEYFEHSINSFSADNIEELFTIDPFFRIYSAVKVKTFAKLKNKVLMGYLLKSLSRSEINSYDNLICFFGEHAWMLIDFYVQENINSTIMTDYCLRNLGNNNIKNYILYYLCTFKPCLEYFKILLTTSYEERNYTLYCLKKITDKFYSFEEDILNHLRSEIYYSFNISILIPLLIARPALITDKIVNELIRIIIRLFNSLAQGHFKLGVQLFIKICDFYEFSNYDIYNDNILKEFYSKIVSFYINYTKSTEDIKIIEDFLQKYNFDINIDSLKYNMPDINNLLKYIQIKSKDTKQIKKILDKYIGFIKSSLPKIEISNELVKHVGEVIDLNECKNCSKKTFFYLLEYKITKSHERCKFSDIENLIYELFKDELIVKITSPKLSTKDNRSVYFNREVYSEVIDYYFNKILSILYNNLDIREILPFITKALKIYNNNKLDISEIVISILLSNITINESISLYSIIYSKIKEGIFIIKQSDLLNCVLNFLQINKNFDIKSLTNLTEIFYFGLISKRSEISEKYFQLFDEMIPKNINLRFYELLDLNWSFCDENYIPYIFTRILLSTFEDINLSTFRLFRAGITNTSFFYNPTEEKIGFTYNEGTYKKYVLNYIGNFQDFILKYAPVNSLKSINDYLFYSYNACINIFESLILNIEIPIDIENIANKIFILVNSINDKERISLVFLKFLNRCRYFNKKSNIKKTIKYLRNGPSCWAYMTDLNYSKIFWDMKLKDFYYGSIRVNSKLPEISKASLFHQLGKVKDAQQIYEEFQTKAINSKISYYPDEYDLVLEEWINCAKELQQWDLTLNIGKQRKDLLLVADTKFYTTNFNIISERESFYNFIKMHKTNDDLDINWLFYELFILLFDGFNTEKAIILIKEINKKLLYGPNVQSYNNYYIIFLQIIFELHEISFVFNNSLENNDKINSVLFRWEDREPDFDNDFISILNFSVWRAHAYRKIEDFSNELKFTDLSVQEGDISGIVNKNKEFTETIKQLKKEMYFKGNNGLGKNSNYLGLASLKRGYYDTALFAFKSVFDLPSIKVIDAYYKVIYELKCFYELKEYKLGLDLANSTNISHFLDDQSSNLYRMRGLFNEKLGFYEEAEKLYFQAIHLSSIGENYYRYIKILMRKLSINNDVMPNKYDTINNYNDTINNNNDTTNYNNNTVNYNNNTTNYNDTINNNNINIENEIIEEILCSILLGLSCSELDITHDIMLIFINLLSKKKISFDIVFFKDLLENCNINTFVFYISKLVSMISTDNFYLISPIIYKISETYPQPVVISLHLFLENKKEPFDRGYKIFTDILKSSDMNFIISILHKFNNVIQSIPFKEECSLLHIVDNLILDIINFSYNFNDIKDKFLELFRTPTMRFHMYNIMPFIDALFINNGSIILCPYKVLDILILMKQKINLLIISTENINNEISRSLYINVEHKKYLFGSFYEIRNDYKNVPYIENLTAITNYSNIKNDKLEDISLICSDGKAYKYEFYKITDKKSNMNFIYNFISHKIKNNYEMIIRGGFLPILKNIQIKNDIFINVVEHSYIDIDYIYEEYRISKKIDNLITEYIKDFNNHVCHENGNNNEIKNSNNGIKNSDNEIKNKYNEDNNNSNNGFKSSNNGIKSSDKGIINNSNNKYNEDNNNKYNEDNKLNDTNDINSKDSIILNLDHKNIIDVLFNDSIKNNKVKNEKYKLSNGNFNICNFIPKLTNKNKLKCFIKILENNAKENILKDYFKSSYNNPYKYLLFKNSMISSYSTHFAISYVLHTIFSNTNDIMIYIDKGTCLNKKLFNTKFMNENNNLKNYLSPNIQHLFGKEGIEGLFLSLIYHTFKESEEYFSDLIVIYEDIKEDNLEKIKERLNKLKNIEDIIKLINEWTNIENISKVPLSEYAWL